MMLKIRNLLIALLITSFPSAVLAQPRIGNITDIFFRIIDTAVNLSGLAAVIYLVFAGYMWMISGGDPQKVQTAQGTITWAIVGLVFIFLLKLILIAIFDFLGA